MRLNLGSGGIRLKDWVNVDIDDADINHDLEDFPYPFENETVEAILISHVLEHFDKPTGYRIASECHRILARDGMLHIAVPDMDKFVHGAVTGDWSQVSDYAWRNLGDLAGGGANERRPHYRHQYIYNFETLAYMLTTVGFEAVWRVDALREWDNPAYERISLYVDARKGEIV